MFDGPDRRFCIRSRTSFAWCGLLIILQERFRPGEKVYVYLWADGIYFNIRLEEPDNNRQCILVLMGATADGRKELIAITDGYRESADSWRELLLEVRQRGLTTSPKVATGDGALGFWATLREIYPQTREQRCWVSQKIELAREAAPSSLPEKVKASLSQNLYPQRRPLFSHV